MKLNELGLIFFCFTLLYSCSSSRVGNGRASRKPIIYKPSEEIYLFPKQSGNFYFTILQLNDVYEIAPVQGGKYGGMARVETIRKELLKENPNTFTVLAGDFLNPSLLGTLKLDGERVKGRQMVEVMNAMNFDLVAFGNHEFDISYEHLQSRLNESSFEWVSSNVLHNIDGRAHYFQKIKNGKKIPVNDSYIQEVYDANGNVVKIGFISACIPSNPIDYVTYGDVFVESQRSYNEIESESDFVLGLTHLSIEEDIQLAKMLPNIPLIMGGHEHTNNYKTIGNVKIAKADANAKSVYIHRLEYNPVTKQINVKSELRVVDGQIPVDKEIETLVNRWQNILDRKIKEVIANPSEVIYNTTVALEGRDTPVRSQQTNLGDIITKALSFGYNNEIDGSILNGGSIRIDDILIGEINAVDIFRVLPYGGKVLKVSLKGDLLNEVLDYAAVTAIGTGAYLHHFNIQKKGLNWFVKNNVVDPEKKYTIAMPEYLIRGIDIPSLKEGADGVVNVYSPTEEELSFDIRKTVVEYLKSLNK